MDIEALTELQQLSVKKIVDQLDELSTEELQQLRLIEEASETPRSSLLSAIDEVRATATVTPQGAEAGAVAPQAASAEAIPPSPWRDPEYYGPLTGEQAAWRNANRKPAGKVQTK